MIFNELMISIKSANTLIYVQTSAVIMIVLGDLHGCSSGLQQGPLATADVGCWMIGEGCRSVYQIFHVGCWRVVGYLCL